MNELKRKILQSDFYKEVYNNKNTRSVELSVASLERGMQEAAAIFQCPIYELSYKVLEEGKDSEPIDEILPINFTYKYHP